MELYRLLGVGGGGIYSEDVEDVIIPKEAIEYPLSCFPTPPGEQWVSLNGTKWILNWLTMAALGAGRSFRQLHTAYHFANCVKWKWRNLALSKLCIFHYFPVQAKRKYATARGSIEEVNIQQPQKARTISVLDVSSSALNDILITKNTKHTAAMVLPCFWFWV